MNNCKALLKYTTKLENTIDLLLKYLGNCNFKGWEPYDVPEFKSLESLKPIRVFLTQLFRLSPLFIHPYFKEKNTHAKAATLFARAFMTLFELTNNYEYREKAIFFLDWLKKYRCPTTKNFSIGNQYHLSMKNYNASPGTPAPLITCFAIEAFLSGHEILKDRSYFELAQSGVKYFLEELQQIHVSNNESYFIYHPNNTQFIPNLPAAVSGTLAHFYSFSKDNELLSIIKKNFNYVVKFQTDEGAWFYHPESRYIDSFHTAFILEALEKYRYYVRDSQYETSFFKGFSYYKKTFFEFNMKPIHKKRLGLPTNADSLLTKIDLRDIAMGLILFSRTGNNNMNTLNYGLDLFNWCITKFRSNKGYFFYQQVPFYTIQGPFLSMQAWMLFGLTMLLKALKNKIKPD